MADWTTPNLPSRTLVKRRRSMRSSVRGTFPWDGCLERLADQVEVSRGPMGSLRVTEAACDDLKPRLNRDPPGDLGDSAATICCATFLTNDVRPTRVSLCRH